MTDDEYDISRFPYQDGEPIKVGDLEGTYHRHNDNRPIVGRIKVVVDRGVFYVDIPNGVPVERKMPPEPTGRVLVTDRDGDKWCRHPRGGWDMYQDRRNKKFSISSGVGDSWSTVCRYQPLTIEDLPLMVGDTMTPDDLTSASPGTEVLAKKGEEARLRRKTVYDRWESLSIYGKWTLSNIGALSLNEAGWTTVLHKLPEQVKADIPTTPNDGVNVSL